MIYSTRFRLISSLIGMTVLVGGLSLIVGARLINSAVVSEATNRIRLDLNATLEQDFSADGCSPRMLT